MRQSKGAAFFLGKRTQRHKQPVLYPEEKKFRSRFKVFSMLLSSLVIVLSVLYFLFYSGYFLILDVSVSGATKFVNSEDVLTLIKNNASGKNTLLFDHTDLEGVLKKNFLGASDFTVRIVYPDSIEVVVSERTPLAIITAVDKNSYLVDVDGYVLGTFSEEYSDLLRIDYQSEVRVGTFIDKQVVPVSLEFINTSKEMNFPLEQLKFSEEYAEAITAGNIKIFIAYDKDVAKAFLTVQNLERLASEQGKMIQKIDLRYNKVIVSYQ